MRSKLLKLLRKPLNHLLLDALRVGGTRGFAAAVAAARRLHALPPAFDPATDSARLLVIALTPHLGDAVMLMPMLEALHAAHPALPLELAVEKSAAALFAGMPELRTVYPLTLGTTPPVSTAATIRRVNAVLREYWKHMRRCRPSVCLMPRWGDDLFRAFFLAALTGAPRRVGFASVVGTPRYRLAPYRDTLLTEAVLGGSGLHEPERMSYLAEAAGLLPTQASVDAGLRVSSAMVRLAESVPWGPLAERLGLPQRGGYAVLAPGASQAHKLWPEGYWQVIVHWLSERGLTVVLLSGESDRAIAERIHRESNGTTTLVAGRTTLAESAAVLHHATLFLGNDSGPAHMAGALGTPSVVLFTASAAADANDPFSPKRNRPLGPNVHALMPEHSTAPCNTTCGADTAHCILAITPERVLQLLQTLLPGNEPVGDVR